MVGGFHAMLLVSAKHSRFFFGGTRVEMVTGEVQMTCLKRLDKNLEAKGREKNSAGSAEATQDEFVNPYKLHSLWWGNYLDHHRG